MMNKMTVLALASGVLLLTGKGVFAEDQGYGYRCDTCPTNWEYLHIEGNNCGGIEQSPIAFSGGDAKGKSSPVRASYGGEYVEPEQTQTNFEWGAEESGYSIRVNGRDYFFKQFHFHTTSEHVVNGERSALEMHFVNKTDDGKAAVLALFIQPGRHNPALAPITDQLPGAVDANAFVDLKAILPRKMTTFAYEGSTTTPPCSANVQWRLAKTPITMSEAQIDAIRNEIWTVNDGFDNNRPIQNREGRKIKSTNKGKGSHNWHDDD
jgi:carbonic anhydrase